MKGCKHDYSRCTTPAQVRRGVQKRIIEQTEVIIAKLSLEQLEEFNAGIFDIPITRDYVCEFCGIYTANKPKCNKCDVD